MAHSEALQLGEIGEQGPVFGRPLLTLLPGLIGGQEQLADQSTGSSESQAVAAGLRTNLSFVPDLAPEMLEEQDGAHFSLVEDLVEASDAPEHLSARQKAARKVAQTLEENRGLQRDEESSDTVAGDKVSEVQGGTKAAAPEIEKRLAASALVRKAAASNRVYGRGRKPRRGSISLRRQERPCVECKETKIHDISQRACTGCIRSGGNHTRKAS